MARWQLRQAFAQAVTSVERPFHTYLEEMSRRVAPPARVGGSVEVFEYLSPKVSGYQRAKSSRGRVTEEVKVADLLGDDSQPWAGTESLRGEIQMIPEIVNKKQTVIVRRKFIFYDF